jgi:hypothetical protein
LGIGGGTTWFVLAEQQKSDAVAQLQGEAKQAIGAGDYVGIVASLVKLHRRAGHFLRDEHRLHDEVVLEAAPAPPPMNGGQMRTCSGFTPEAAQRLPARPAGIACSPRRPRHRRHARHAVRGSSVA